MRCGRSQAGSAQIAKRAGGSSSLAVLFGAQRPHRCSCSCTFSIFRMVALNSLHRTLRLGWRLTCGTPPAVWDRIAQWSGRPLTTFDPRSLVGGLGCGTRGEGHQNNDQESELAVRSDVRSSSTVAFSLLYVGLCRILGFIGFIACARRSESDRDIEIMVLRHQVRILERQRHERLRYRPVDRAALAALSRVLPRSRWRSFLVTPDTLLRWHREASTHKWRRWRKQRGPGRPPMSDELVGLIVRLGRENRRWGCVRIQE